jgi:NAD(P)-dependent dehydrogenase (short-subunit alcohol dehydrogenase family)
MSHGGDIAIPFGGTWHSTLERKMTTNQFEGKTAFVTGAGSGIGRATALAFAREGASVMVVGQKAESIQETVRLIEAAGGRAQASVCDVSQEADVIAAIDKTIEAFGRLDFAFNNAGIEQPNIPLADLPVDVFDKLIAVNLRGVFLCMKYQIPHLLEQGGGAIVNTSSGAGVKGFPTSGGYAASKHGVIGLTKTAALDYASAKIRINAICPGIIETPMMDRFSGGTPEGRQAVIAQEPVGRMGKPEEIAATVIWLCSDGAAFAVGSAFVVDGGQTA